MIFDANSSQPINSTDTANASDIANPDAMTANTVPTRPKQRITPRALLETKRLSDPQLHPDGQRVAFVVTEADFDESHFLSHLWLTEHLLPETTDVESAMETADFKIVTDIAQTAQTDADSKTPDEDTEPAPAYDPTRQLTFSGDGEIQPRWSPDGRYLAFLSSRPDETEPAPDDDEAATEQVWILPIDGGEARKVTSAKEGVLDYAWIPDTDAILYLASEPRPRSLESLRKDERNRRKVDPIVELEDRQRRQLWRMDVDDTKPKLLLTGDYGIMDFAISHDGERLAFITNYSGEGNDYHRSDLYVRYLAAGKTIKLVARGGGKYHLRWSPDDTQIAFLSWLDPELSYSRECIFVVDVQKELSAETSETYGPEATGISECRLITDFDQDISVFEWAHPGEEAMEAGEEEEKEKGEEEEKEEAIVGYALAAVRTGSAIVMLQQGISFVQNTVSFVEEALAERYDLSRDPGGNKLVYVEESENALPEIFLRDEQGAIHILTKLNADFSENYLLPHQEVVTWNSPDGLTIEGVLTYPFSKDPNASQPPLIAAPLPLIVQIHGGPKGRSSNTLQNYNMAPVWAAEGYAVLRPNFRGSEGYGNAFAIANRRDLGGGDFADIMAGVDWCIAQGIADPERLGVMGGSYGGYMTNWAIGHTDRFKAAVSQFGIFHLQTDYSNSELSRWENEYLGAYYWEDPETYHRLSPGSYIGAIKTPTLIIHGDEDTNTFISNSKEMYQALRHRGVTTQFVHYPREGHGVREPNHKLDEMRRCLAWMDKYVRESALQPGLYRIGDRIPSHGGSLELNIARAEITTFVGQPKPTGTAGNAEVSELLEVALTIHNLDTRLSTTPLMLKSSDIRLEVRERAASSAAIPTLSTISSPASTMQNEALLPIGIPLDVFGGKVLVEGENLRTSQRPDEETGQLGFGFAVVFRVPKSAGEGSLRVADFPPVKVQWTASDEEDESKENEIT